MQPWVGPVSLYRWPADYMWSKTYTKPIQDLYSFIFYNALLTKHHLTTVQHAKPTGKNSVKINQSCIH